MPSGDAAKVSLPDKNPLFVMGLEFWMAPQPEFPSLAVFLHGRWCHWDAGRLKSFLTAGWLA